MSDPTSPKDGAGRGVLAIGGTAALLASTCCLGPLVLAMLGFSGAWIGNLTRLEPFRPYFLAVALLALGIAGRRIFRPSAACTPGPVCARPQARGAYQRLFWVVTGLSVLALGFPYVIPYFY